MAVVRYTSSLNIYAPKKPPLPPSNTANNRPPPTTVIFGPAATTWFAFLARRINFPSRPNLTIAARVLTDQTVFASANLGCFLTSMAVMEGSDPKKKLEGTYWTALKKNWMLWPAVQAVNFKLVPLEHRVLVVNVVSLGELILPRRGSERGGDFWRGVMGGGVEYLICGG